MGTTRQAAGRSQSSIPTSKPFLVFPRSIHPKTGRRKGHKAPLGLTWEEHAANDDVSETSTEPKQEIPLGEAQQECKVEERMEAKEDVMTTRLTEGADFLMDLRTPVVPIMAGSRSSCVEM